MIPNGTTVLYKHQRCACVGGGTTENYGTIMGAINAPNGLFYKINTDYQGTFVVPVGNIIRIVDGN